jgi:hypothetical protein
MKGTVQLMTQAAPSNKATSIKIDATLLERLAEYRGLTGVSMQHSINEAVRDYLDAVVPARLAVFGKSLVSQNDKLTQGGTRRARGGGIPGNDFAFWFNLGQNGRHPGLLLGASSSR